MCGKVEQRYKMLAKLKILTNVVKLLIDNKIVQTRHGKCLKFVTENSAIM